MQPGIYLDLSNAEYHGGEGINKGLLDVVARSPLHAKAVLDQSNDNKREPTPAMVIGTAFHTLVLEPHKFTDEYVCELTQADAPDAIADRETLVAMVEALNETRLAKLPTGGTKDEMVARIIGALAEMRMATDMDTLAQIKGAELKAFIERLNQDRPGKFSTSGSMADLRDILNANGHSITLWSDVRARWAEENTGYTVLTVDTFNQLLAMRDSVMAHPMARALLTGCPDAVAEASIYWTDPVTGELCRCRPDFWRADGIVVDVKTTEDASPEGFAKSLATYRYHVQAPWYLGGAAEAHAAGHFPEGWDAPKLFVFLTVEKRAPYAVACYALDEASLEIGTAQMRGDLDKLAECKRTDTWPGYGDKLQMLGVPAHYLNKNLHLLGAA